MNISNLITHVTQKEAIDYEESISYKISPKT